jgi:type II secretory pathway predicted ATPase ExeA
MDLRRFGLKRRPFPSTPDSATYYPATGHETAVAALARGLADGEPLVALVGPAGTGKTLAAHVLLDRLTDDPAVAFVTNSHCADRAALLQAILFDLGLSHDGTEQTLRLRLTDLLLKTCADGKRTLLVIDEAHHLDADLLEELRLLANLESGQGRAVQVVLVGQPPLLETLDRPALASLRQRLTVRGRLDALPAEEAYDYLLHHLRLAGGEPERIIDETGLDTLARGTGGVPRLLNQAGQQALRLADEGDADRVEAEAALGALEALGLTIEEGESEGPCLLGRSA